MCHNVGFVANSMSNFTNISRLYQAHYWGYRVQSLGIIPKHTSILSSVTFMEVHFQFFFPIMRCNCFTDIHVTVLGTTHDYRCFCEYFSYNLGVKTNSSK